MNTQGHLILAASAGALLLAASLGRTARAQAPINPGVEVVNTSAAAVTSTWFKAHGMADWQRVARGKITARGRTFIRIATESHCYYDLRFVFSAGAAEQHRVDICKQPTLRIGAGRH